jgi:hypothetical protein
MVDQRLDEGRFIEIEERIAGSGRRSGLLRSTAGAAAAAAPPTTAPFRKSRRPKPLSVM